MAIGIPFSWIYFFKRRWNKKMKLFQGIFLLTVLTLAALLGFPSHLMAQVWSNLGLYGGQIYDIAIDPLNPDKMFAGSYWGDGLFKTMDGGNSWEAVETEDLYDGEDSFKNHAVWAVKIAPSNPNVVWAAHNYWVEKSTDGGQTWTHIFNSTMQRDCPNCGGVGDNFRFCRSLAIDPTNPNIVYVGTGGPIGTYSPGAIYKTDDGGNTWNKLNQGNNLDHTVTDISIDPQDANIIWAVTSSYGAGVWAGTLYRSTDGGQIWNSIMVLDSGFTSVSVKPNDSNRVFTGSGYGIIEHYFDGALWQFRWPVIPESSLVEQISFAPQNPQIVYAVWLTPISWGGDGIGKIARSLDGGNTWLTQDIYPHSYDFISIGIHPTNAELLFAGDRNLGVYRSEDHGQNWTPINNGLNAVIVYDVAVDPNDSTHMLAGTISGVYEKRGGGSWSRLLSYETRSLQFHPTDSLTFYAGLWGSLAKTTDGGANWGFTNLNVNNPVKDIAIHPTTTDTIFVAVGSEVQLSEDGASTFQKVLDGVNLSGASYDFNVVTINPSNTEHVFAGGGNFYAPKVFGDLWESLDGGINWARTSLQNVIVNSLLVDPENPDVMYAGCGYSGGTEIPLYKSTDAGSLWAASYEQIPGAVTILMGVWGNSGTDVFTVGRYGAFRPEAPIFQFDGGSWTEMSSGVTEDLHDLWGTSGTNVYAMGTSGTILRYDGTSWSAMNSGTTENLNGVWGSSATNVFAVGDNGTILRYDGTSWSAMNSGTTENLNGVWGSSATNVFAVGDNGTILRYDGTSWSAMNSGTTENLNGVWGSSATNVFAVGDNGTIVRYDGTSWSAMNSGTTENLNGVWGSSATNVFAVGDNGTILHYDGTSWSAMNSATTKWLNAVWGSSATDIFAVGHSSIILHYDGNTWTDSSLGTTERLQDVWGSSAIDVFVVGDLGGISRYNGTTWTVIRSAGSNGNAVTDLEFHRENTSVIYAGTFGAGVYVSPNHAKNWLNFGTPQNNVFAISTSSLYAGTQAGLWQCTGTGVVAGQLTDPLTQTGIDGAIVFNDLGAKTISIKGEYIMVTPVGVFSITAIKDNYANKTIEEVYVNGGDVTWANATMEAGVSDSSVLPGAQVGGGSGSSGLGCLISTLAYEFSGSNSFHSLRSFKEDHFLIYTFVKGLIGLFILLGPVALVRRLQFRSKSQ
jgi:hypothetical protein